MGITSRCLPDTTNALKPGAHILLDSLILNLPSNSHGRRPCIGSVLWGLCECLADSYSLTQTLFVTHSAYLHFICFIQKWPLAHPYPVFTLVYLWFTLGLVFASLFSFRAHGYPKNFVPETRIMCLLPELSPAGKWMEV